jgi:acyl dehydratase
VPEAEGACASRIEEYAKGKHLVFDEIEVGMEFPEVRVSLSEETCRAYCRVVGEEGAAFRDRSSALAEGYGDLVAPPSIVCLFGTPTVLFSGCEPKLIPPPGNVHYSQEYEFRKAVSPGDVLSIRSRVLRKEIRRERKHVTIESEYVNGRGQTVAVGRITAVWAK